MIDRRSRVVLALIAVVSCWGIVASLVTIFGISDRRQLASVYESTDGSFVPEQQSADIVKNFAAQHGILFGTSYNIPDGKNPPTAPRPADFLDRLAPYFNFYQVSYSFQTTETKEGVFNLGDTDNLLAFAKAHGAPVKVHTLFYPGTTPKWISPDGGWTVEKNTDGTDKYSPDQLKDIEKNHIFGLINHFKGAFPGVIKQYQVTNEVTCTAGMVGTSLCASDDVVRNYLWTSVHKDGSTDPTDYIQLAFQWAKEADPSGELYFTESLGSPGPGADKIYDLVKGLQDKGVPIDGFGMQGHVSLNWPYSSNALVAMMNKFADLGLDVQVTEFDVTFSTKAGSGSNPAPLPLTAENLNQQGRLYRLWFDACLHAKRCVAFTAFTPWDPASFYFGHPEVTNPSGLIPGLLDESFQQKPAYTYLVQESKEYGQNTVPLTYPAYLYLDTASSTAKFTSDGGMNVTSGGLGKKMNFPETGTYALAFGAYGIPEGNVYPEMNITVDGNTVKTFTVNTQSLTEYIAAVSLEKGEHLIGVSIANPGKTRALVVATLGAAPAVSDTGTSVPPGDEPDESSNSGSDPDTPTTGSGGGVIGSVGDSAGGYPVTSPVDNTAVSTDQSLDAPVSSIIHITSTQTLPVSVPQNMPKASTSKPTLTQSAPAAATITAIDYMLDGALTHTASTFPDTWTLDTTTLANDWHTLTTTYHRADNTTTESIKFFKVQNKQGILEWLKDGTVRIFTTVQSFLKTVF